MDNKPTLQTLFHYQAEQLPDKLCIKEQQRQISYKEMDHWSDTLAYQLQNAGVVSGQPIGLYTDRSAAAIAAILAIVKIGACYVPLSPEFPPARIQLIIDDVQLKVIYVSSPFTDKHWKNVNKLLLTDFPETTNTAAFPLLTGNQDDPAYIMYTSGSTGKPKGIIIPHRAILRLVSPENNYCQFNQAQCFLQLAPLAFDASTFEIWGALLNGASCVVVSGAGMPTPDALAKILAEGITTLWLTSSIYNAIISDNPACLKTIKQLLIGGEALSVPHVQQGLKQLPKTQIINGYGPTENTTFTTAYPIPRNLSSTTQRIPIGYPLHGTHCEVFDAELNPVIEGQQGELITFGQGLAIGYLKRSELNAQRFTEVICADGIKRRGYRTGDIVIKLTNGCYDYLKRNDKQVKIDGHRIEPEEIERCLNQFSSIKEARVIVKTGAKAQKRLAAYIVGSNTLNPQVIRAELSDKIPRFMMPHFIIPLTALPTNQNGKLDEAKLPDPFQTTPISPVSTISNQQIANCWQQILGRDIADNLNFLEAGGTSLEALQLTELLKKSFQRDIDSTFVFGYPNIASQADFFNQQTIQKTSAERLNKNNTSIDVAVVGMACRFPQANNLDEFWDNLINGKESIRFFDDAELSAEISQAERTNPHYVRAKGIIDGCQQFDAAFFGISPVEAKILDPQQRIMLQLAYHALEDAGIAKNNLHRIGVFAGTNWARYFQQYVLNNEEIKRNYGLFNASLANETDFLSTRISYKLNLTGPSLNISTACSTGLVAISQAYTSIQNEECEMALAGGVSISTPINSGYLYQEGGMLAKDGHCRPFDKDATGTTFNDGAGLVVLKRLDLAEADDDTIYAVIKGSAVNNDGANKASFTAPSVAGQVAVYDAALANANVSAESIGYIETHGTATPLGDPIEVKSLSQSYAGSIKRPASCAMGSVKSNIGHTIHAAGVASFIKTVMAVNKGLIPPTLHFKTANPKLNLDDTPFYVNNKLQSWHSETPRRAAISALGVGGTNAHVIIEQYIAPDKPNNAENFIAPHPAYSILLSAQSLSALELQITRYQHFFASQAVNDKLADVAYTSAKLRQHLPFRTAVSGLSNTEIASKLAKTKQLITGKANHKPLLGFMFSGQGAQRQLMGRWLYQHHTGFRQLIDQGSDIILVEQGFDLRTILLNDQPTTLDVNQTKIAQPLLFLYEYGLARYLQACGCQADFLIGHSIGEYTAAVLAGVFSFEEGVKLVAARGALMQSMPTGNMLAVKATREQISDLFSPSLSLAAINAPNSLVLSGTVEVITETKIQLSKRTIQSTLLQTSHAFHSQMMQPIVAEFEALVNKVNLQPPNQPIFSTLTGKLLTDPQATDPSYWASQLRKPVLFSDAINAARQQYDNQALAFVEVGPGITLSTLVGFQNKTENNTLISATPNSATDDKFIDELSHCLNRLWISGVNIDWQRHFKNNKKTALPNYAFLPTKHWLETAMIKTQTGSLISPPIHPETMSMQEHQQAIEKKIRTLLEEVTGFDLDEVDANTYFSEAGLDSLLLTQAALAIENEFSVGITFRHLMEQYNSIAELSEFIADKIPPISKPVTTLENRPNSVSPHIPMANEIPNMTALTTHQPNNDVQQLIQQQLQIMQLQLLALNGTQPNSPTSQPVQAIAKQTSKETPEPTKANTKEKPVTRQTPATRINRERIGVELTKAQRQWLNEMMQAYQIKYAKSKQQAQKYRQLLADPRTVSGFNPEWKEIIFPIVTVKSKGSKLWDLDGNELIDTANGFGPIFFGHSPDFITDAIKQQLDKGIETGPQSPIAGEVAELFCELTGNERCSFASTGSEAVMGAVRLARTVTGRNKVLMFDHDYHGIFDEVVVRSGRNYQGLPAASGIPREMTENMLVLPWGQAESLEVLKTLCADLAAVLLEPVQSRQPEFHDQAYLKAIRKITQDNGTAMILDEVVTGFRVHAGGIRQRFDIDADLCTYGKVVGGGYPIGIIGGKAKFMDALDGGYWQFGDDSIPESGVTFFAGTFVRHPLALTAAKAVMERIKTEGQGLYDELEQKTDQMTAQAKDFIATMKCEVSFESFASLFYVAVPTEAHWGHMLFVLMTLEGIHIQQFRPNFLTTEHNAADIEKILHAFKKSLAQLVSYGLIKGDMMAAKQSLKGKPNIPVGARLGKNAQGEPAYFIPDPDHQGAYIEVGKA